MALRKGIFKFSDRRSFQHFIRAQRLATQSAKKITDGEKLNDGQTHFGFQTIDENEKWKKVHNVFETVAEKYDLMNDVMSFGIHRIWKDIFMARLAPTHETKLLDVAGGTGDITFRYIKYLQNVGPAPEGICSSVTVCDINQSMLDIGKLRANRQGLSKDSCGVNMEWLCADAERLPLPDDSYSAYTIAFGIRNCTHIQKVLEEAYRVLTPGGRFMCLEFSHLPNSTLQWVYDQYSFQVIPVMGHLVAGQWKPYQYLVESIRQFPNQEKFKSMIEDAGFRQVTYENLTFGTVAIHSGFKI